VILVYKYRVKSLGALLNRQAQAVSFVWNFCNDRQKDALKWGRRWLTGFDLNKLTAGGSRELSLHAGTINAVCEQYAKSRSQKKRPFLRYRGKRSLGWVPFKGRDLRETRDGFIFHGREFRVFKSRPLPTGAKIKDGGSFSRDARGNWFLNVCIEVQAVTARAPISAVGIDLGLKDIATLSTGEKIKNPQHFRQLEEALGKAQRARKKRQARSIHACIANARQDALHKAALSIVRRFDYIAVGDVNAARLAQTRLAKSVKDAGWSSFRNMLRYKATAHGAWYEEVNERFSSQVCSSCGDLPDSRPRGIADLGIRRWICSGCGAEHDRDVNAALNILARSGHRAPVEGAPAV
jgi:IS605 OrfB family transposase